MNSPWKIQNSFQLYFLTLILKMTWKTMKKKSAQEKAEKKKKKKDFSEVFFNAILKVIYTDFRRWSLRNIPMLLTWTWKLSRFMIIHFPPLIKTTWFIYVYQNNDGLKKWMFIYSSYIKEQFGIQRNHKSKQFGSLQPRPGQHSCRNQSNDLQCKTTWLVSISVWH